MDTPPPLSLLQPLPRPHRGGATRTRVGSAELVLENVRGGYTLLWSDGRQARRYALGLADFGHLALELKAPRLPVRVVPRETITVVPGGRLAGYLDVSLVPTLTWRGESGRAETLIELHPPELTCEWDEQTGHSFRCASSWLVRFPMRRDEPRIIVPLRVRNDGSTALSPAFIALHLRDEDLQPTRGSIVVRPTRYHRVGDSLVRAHRSQGAVAEGCS
jgi:hypothetical protein